MHPTSRARRSPGRPSRVTAVVVLASVVLLAGPTSRVAARDVTEVDDVAPVVHYGARENRALADAVAEVLGAYDYRVIARLPAKQSGPGEVRYFYPPDRTAAIHVQSIVANVLAGKGKPERVKLVPDSPRRTGAKLGRIDIRIPSANDPGGRPGHPTAPWIEGARPGRLLVAAADRAETHTRPRQPAPKVSSCALRADARPVRREGDGNRPPRRSRRTVERANSGSLPVHCFFQLSRSAR